ncbi:MAG: isoprenylcysteine carboxylmethyltransferase family protein [Bryobacteraceae bacterium]|jgi:protein-S-isoprenylcysteine O-methyltransferase Ste14
MRATNWEFKNRALVFGLIFGFAFGAYSIDPQNSTAALANWLGATLGINANLIARILFAVATCLLFGAALLRTRASSYLHSSVVYAEEVKTESLVADGPYRHTRNPLYLANVLLAIGMGALMSRLGFFVAAMAMLLFCYRLIQREESALVASQGAQYDLYRNAVPRLWPAFKPRTAAAGGQASWSAGFRAEFSCWGFAVAVAAFAITLNTTAFFVILGASIVLLWLSRRLIQRNTRGAPAADP